MVRCQELVKHVRMLVNDDVKSLTSQKHQMAVTMMGKLLQAVLLADRATHLGMTLYLWGFVLLTVALMAVARPLLGKWRSHRVPELALPIALLRQSRSGARLRGD